MEKLNFDPALGEKMNWFEKLRDMPQERKLEWQKAFYFGACLSLVLITLGWAFNHKSPVFSFVFFGFFGLSIFFFPSIRSRVHESTMAITGYMLIAAAFAVAAWRDIEYRLLNIIVGTVFLTVALGRIVRRRRKKTPQ